MDHTDQYLSSLASINIDKSRSNLTTLPVEVRLCTYEYVLATPYRLVPPGPGTVVRARPFKVALLRVNQQIHQEATPVFYRINSFYINVMPVIPHLEEYHFKYGLPSSALKVLLSQVTCPIPIPFIASLRRLSLRLDLQRNWRYGRPNRRRDQFRLAIAVSCWAHFIDTVISGGAVLSVLSLTFRKSDRVSHLRWDLEATRLMDEIDLDGTLLAAVKRLVREGSTRQLGRLEIWKDIRKEDVLQYWDDSDNPDGWSGRYNRDGWARWYGPSGTEALWKNEPEQALKVKRSWPLANIVEFGIRNVNLEGEKSRYVAVGTAISF